MDRKLKMFLYLGKLLVVLTVVLIAGLVLFTTLPGFRGYKAMIVSSGSMEPFLKTGSMVFIKESKDIKKGDVVTYQLNPDSQILVTHRVIDFKKNKNGKYYQTKGDAVSKPDMQLVKETQVVGKLFLTIPYLGIPVSFAKTQTGVLVLVVIPASIIIYEEFKTILKEVKKLRTKVDTLEKKEEEMEEQLKKHPKRKRK